MIDFHSHIIPGIDDGSRSVEETFNMIDDAKNAGFTDIIMTSHFMTHSYEPTTSEILVWKEKLQEVLNSKNIDITLHSGMEVYISSQLKELLKENKLLTIGGSNYLLIEFPLRSLVNYWDYSLYILQSMSIIPIIAHPERYGYVQDNPGLIDDFIEKGALIQCNYGSIIEEYGKRAKHLMKTMLKNHQVHFLGSDCHRQDGVYTKIPKAVEKIKKIIGEDEFLELSTLNPRKVLNNEKW